MKHKIVYIGNDKWSKQLEHIVGNLDDRCEVAAVFTEPEAKNFDDYPLVFRGNINKKTGLLKDIAPDFMLEYGCHYLFKRPVLEIAPVIGMHPTLLPERRGRAPLNWTLIDGLKESGVTMFYLNEGVDSGDIIYQKKFQISEKDNVRDLVGKVNDILIEMNTDLINNYPDVPKIPQDNDKATYKEKRTLNDGEIDWSRPSEEIDRLIRATTRPYPGAFFYHGDKKIIVWEAEIEERGEEQ